MRTLKHLLTVALILSTITLWAQFGGGGGGGFGGGRSGGGPGGSRQGNEKPSQTLNPNQQNTQESIPSGPKIGTITGNVADNNKIPIEYATIAVVDSKTKKVITGDITNHKGDFTIKQLPAGNYSVKITFIGFLDYVSEPFDISSSHKIQNIGKVVLKENENMLDDVVVTADVTTIENRIDKQVVNVGKDLMTAGASTRDVFEKLPMVNVDFDGKVSLRGSNNVRVLLDNRPTNMSVQDLIESLPADAIDKIELITNPSAKQDPDGMAGIINIITKKTGALYGLTLSARVGVDTKNKWNGGVNFGYHLGKVVVHANYNFRYNSFDSSGETYRANYNLSDRYPKPYLNYMTSANQNTMVAHSLRAGIDYLPNKKTSLSYTVGYNPTRRDSKQESSSYFLPLDTPMDQMTKDIALDIVEQYKDDLDSYFNRYRNSTNKNSTNTLRNSLTFRQDYNSTDNLIVDVNYEISDSDGKSSIENRVGKASTGINSRDHSTNDTQDKEFTVQADYTKSFGGKSTLEVGGKADLLWRNTPYFYFIDVVEAPQLGSQPDMNRSNHFKYAQQLYSAYATYSRKFKNFTVQLGLRAEETITKSTGLGMKNDNGNIVYVKDENVVIDRDYFQVYPSLGLMYKFGKDNTFNFNYSRRVSRPNSYNLNPTPRFSDPLYVSIGNPYLDPSFTNTIDFRYSRSLSNKGFFNISYFFRNSTDMMQSVTQRENPVDPDKTEPGTLYTTTINIGSQYTTGFNMYASYKIFNWWNAMLSVNYYYNHKDIPDRDDYVRASNDFSAFMNNNFNISKIGTRIQFSMMYSAPRANLQGTSSAMFFASAGISQDFLKKKINASIRVNDLFNTMSQRGDTFGKDFILYNNYNYTSRIVNFSIAYKINEMKFKDKRLKNMSGDGLPTVESPGGN